MQRDPIADSGVPPATSASSPEDTTAGNDSPQPPPATRVEEYMGTLAIHPGILNGDLPSRAQGRVPAYQPPSAPVDLSLEALQRRAEAVARGDLSVLSDAEVMLELKAGNMAAFDVLLAKYRRPIVHFMFRMVHNQGVAEELAQEVFLRVYRSRETYRAEARFSTWLYRIA
ncbi:MAG: RNA polymerase sigma factor, partial [Janthinobacterium lividum]